MIAEAVSPLGWCLLLVNSGLAGKSAGVFGGTLRDEIGPDCLQVHTPCPGQAGLAPLGNGRRGNLEEGSRLAGATELVDQLVVGMGSGWISHAFILGMPKVLRKHYI